MKLWLAERNEDKVGYDQYDSWVVAAENEMQVNAFTKYGHEAGYKVRVIGTPLPDQARGIVLASFNAG